MCGSNDLLALEVQIAQHDTGSSLARHHNIDLEEAHKGCMCRLDLERQRVQAKRTQLAQQMAEYPARREAEAAAQAEERLRQQQRRDRDARRHQQRLHRARQVELTRLVRDHKELEAAAREVAMQLKADQQAARLKVSPHPLTHSIPHTQSLIACSLAHPLNYSSRYSSH